MQTKNRYGFFVASRGEESVSPRFLRVSEGAGPLSMNLQQRTGGTLRRSAGQTASGMQSAEHAPGVKSVMLSDSQKEKVYLVTSEVGNALQKMLRQMEAALKARKSPGFWG